MRDAGLQSASVKQTDETRERFQANTHLEARECSSVTRIEGVDDVVREKPEVQRKSGWTSS